MAGANAHPTRRPGSFEIQLRKQENSRAFQEARKKKEEEQAKLKKQLKDAREKADYLKASKISAEKTLAERRTILKAKEAAAILPSSPGGVGITPAELAEVVLWRKYVAETKAQVQTLTTAYVDATDKLKSLTKQANPGPDASTKNRVNNAKANPSVIAGHKGDKPGDSLNLGGPTAIVYNYNAPMVKGAYLSPFGVQAQTSTRTVSDPGNYQDAKMAWSDNLGAKGTIQMSRKYVYNNPTSTSKTKPSVDTKLYGFKFLYNPKEVSMAWGTSTEVNWDYVSLGLDKASAVALGILKSTITFSLLLNRTGDMAYLEQDGYLSSSNPNDSSTTLYLPSDIYPSDVSTEDLQTIYKKGTMYDLEYLFRTIMGLNANYNSSLNGMTADRGWLNAAPVELHLGDGMRYLVRISTLDVNHIIFNDRMVPIVSSVNVTCHRFYDGTDASLDTSKTSNSDASGGIG